ncbi:MAG: cell wall hydrolase, partial [Bacillus sp. (in: firmicutes)]
MAVVKHTNADIELLARLLRAEAEGEGNQGMLLVGNVGINRIRANCSDFKGLRT